MFAHRKPKIELRLTLTVTNILIYLSPLQALVDLFVRENGEFRAASFRPTESISAVVHGTLERVALPAEDVVPVLSVPSSDHSN
jgi:hypothetical protein